jgi:hypothetical protein
MAIDKLSISMDESLTEVIRSAAVAEGVSVSAWLTDAAQDRIRNRSLRVALDADEPEISALSDAELDALVRRARANAIVTGAKRVTKARSSKAA